MSSSTDLSQWGSAVSQRQFAPLRMGAGPVLIDEHEAARSVGYAEGWAQGRREAVEVEREESRRAEESHQRLERALAAEAQRARDALWSAVQQIEATTAPVLEDAADVVARRRGPAGRGGTGGRAVRPRRRRHVRPTAGPGPVAGRRSGRRPPEPAGPADPPCAGESGAAAEGTQRVEGHDVELVADSGLRRGEAVADQGAARVDARLGRRVASCRGGRRAAGRWPPSRRRSGGVA